MKEITIKCPAKINLDLKVFPKDELTGFHPIESIMQTINLCDYITIILKEGNLIKLNGTSNEIPYNEQNICHKAINLFQEELKQCFDISIYIKKNIPVCAGLAGGSTNAAGVLYGINKLLNSPFDKNKLHKLAEKLGSDLNFCLEGGKQLCKGRGEKLTKLDFEEFPITLVKPKNLQISAKNAYCAFDELKEKSNMPNDLEFALLNKHKELQFLNSKGMQMSGSGPTYFIKKEKLDFHLDDNFQIIENLKSVNYGVEEIK